MCEKNEKTKKKELQEKFFKEMSEARRSENFYDFQGYNALYNWIINKDLKMVTKEEKDRLYEFVYDAIFKEKEKRSPEFQDLDQYAPLLVKEVE